MRWIIAALVCLLAVAPLAAQNDEATPNLIPDETCTSNSVVFAYSENGVYDVFAIEGNERVNLTNDDANDYFAALSPDMEQIAFISDRNSDVTELYLMSSEGGNVRQVTHDGLPKGYFNWSLDSRRIAYAAFYNASANWQQLFATAEDFAGQPADLFIVEIATGDVTQITDGLTGVSVLAWSQDMDQIAFFGHQDGAAGIYTVPAEGGDVQLVVELDEDSIATTLFWSPDSSYIAYTLVTSEADYQVFIVEVTTGNITDLTVETSDLTTLSGWTADSTSVIRSTIDDGQTLELVNLETGEASPLWEITAQALCLENVRAANALLTGEVSTP